MKKLTYCLGILLIVLGGFFQSCDDGGYSIGDIAVDWATIDAKDAHAYSLVGDRWGALWPAATSIPWYAPIDGQRVIVVFNPLSDDFQGYDCAVKVEGIREVLTKQIEQLIPENEEDFGNDPIAIIKDYMWISGGFLNVVFKQDRPLEVKHRISLVYADSLVPDEEGYVHLELRYNTYDDVTGVWASGAVSFNLNAIEKTSGLKGIKVKVTSAENGEIEIPFELLSSSVPEAVQKMDFSKMELH